MSMQDRINALRGAEPVQVVSAPQLFPTPSRIADLMVSYADIEEKSRILEPSAGTGNILNAIMDKNKGIPIAIEISPALCEILKNKFPLTDVHCRDFLAHDCGKWKYDRIIMNPPFKNGEDIKHILHALTMLKDGGILVAICANGPRQRNQLMDLADHWEDLPEGSFKNQGTNVNTALIVITK